MLYYTGAVKPEEIQRDPSASLGGYKSSTQVPNGSDQNLFPEITQSTVIQDKKIIRMIVFQNITPATMQNIKIYIENGEYSLFTMCAIAPAYDTVCERYFFEKLNDEQQIPYQGTLEVHDVDNPIIVTSLDSQKYFGLWIRRALDQSKFSDIDRGEDLSCDLTIEALQEKGEQGIVKDEMKLHIEWD